MTGGSKREMAKLAAGLIRTALLIYIQLQHHEQSLSSLIIIHYWHQHWHAAESTKNEMERDKVVHHLKQKEVVDFEEGVSGQLGNHSKHTLA